MKNIITLPFRFIKGLIFNYDIYETFKWNCKCVWNGIK